MVLATSRISGGPAGVALGLLGFLLAIWWLRREQALSATHLLVGAALSVYAAGVLANTAFPVYLGKTYSAASWTDYLNLVPLRNTEARDIVQNVVIFAPLGLLLPLALPLRSALGVIACAAVVSLSIEGLQLLNAVTGHGGHIADVNDLLANVLGAVLGYAVTRAAIATAPGRRVILAFAWPGSGLRSSPR